MCDDCHARPGWHKLWCPRVQRSMYAMTRRLRRNEKEASNDGQG